MVEHLIATICKSDVPLDRVSLPGGTQLLHQAKRASEKALRAIERDMAAGKHRVARVRVNRLRKKSVFWLHSAAVAFRRLHRRAPRENDVPRIVQAARSLRYAPTTPAAFIKKVPKRGGQRTTYKFSNLEDRARFHFEAMLLKSTALLHPKQTSLRGGRSKACLDVWNALKGVDPNQSIILNTDVRDCFGSIDPLWARHALRLRGHTIDTVVLTSGLRVCGSTISGIHETQTGGGIPQGSALSSVVAEIAMAHALKAFSDRVQDAKVFSYSDNSVVLTTVAEADRTETLLRSAFAQPGGPFGTRDQLSIRRSALSEGFYFQGYQFRWTGNGLVARMANAEWLEQLVDAVEDILDQGTPWAFENALMLFEREARSKEASFPLDEQLSIDLNSLWMRLFD